MRKIAVGLGVALVAVLVLIGFGWSRLDKDAVVREVLSRVEKEAGIKVEAASYSLHPWLGLSLVDGMISGRVGAGEVIATVSTVQIEHRIVPLLWGELVLDQVLLTEPDVTWRTPSVSEIRQQKAENRERRRQARQEAKAAKEAENLAAQDETGSDSAVGDDRIRLGVESFEIRDGSLRIETNDGTEPEFEVADLNLEVRGLSFDPNTESSTEAVSGKGRFSTDEIRHGELHGLRSSGRIAISRGKTIMTDLVVESSHSELMIGKMTVNLVKRPFSYKWESQGSVDLNGVLKVLGEPGFGDLQFSLEGAGKGPELEAISGSGTVTLEEGAVPPLPSVVQVEEIVDRDLLTGREYQAAQIQFSMAAGRLELEPFEIAAEGAEIAVSGTIELAGRLDLNISVRLPLPGSGSGQSPQAKLGIPLRITGTVEEPTVRLAHEGMEELGKEVAPGWIEMALEEAKAKASEWLESQSEDDEN